MTRTGWFFPPRDSRKAHYWTNWDEEPRAICMKYWLHAMLDPREFKDDNHDSPDNCAECKRRRARADAKNTHSLTTNPKSDG